MLYKCNHLATGFQTWRVERLYTNLESSKQIRNTRFCQKHVVKHANADLLNSLIRLVIARAMNETPHNLKMCTKSDGSKAVETFPNKVTELLNLVFLAPKYQWMNVTRMQIFQPRQKKKNNKTIFTELQNFKLDSIFHSFKTAIPTGGISIQANFRNLFSKLSPHCPSCVYFWAV